MSTSTFTKALPTLESLQEAFRGGPLYQKPKALIGASGGRSFIMQVGDATITVKMKDLITHLDRLAKAAFKQSPGDKEKLSKTIRELVEEINDLDVAGEVAVAMATPWQKIMTAVRRFFGNLCCSSHVKRLATLYKKPVGEPFKPGPLSEEAKALYAEFVKASKDKQVQKIIKLLQKSIESGRKPSNEEEKLFNPLKAITQKLRNLSMEESIQITEKTMRHLPHFSFVLLDTPAPIIMQKASVRSAVVKFAKETEKAKKS